MGGTSPAWCYFKGTAAFLLPALPLPSHQPFPTQLSPPFCLLTSALLISQPLCRCLSLLQTLLISTSPCSSSVYITKTLVQVKHVFLINTFPLIAGKKILQSSRFCTLGIDNENPLYPSSLHPTGCGGPTSCRVIWRESKGEGRGGGDLPVGGVTPATTERR